jgi:hypothetical protein
MSANGDQTQVLEYCLNLLSKANELWVFGNWEQSEGCLIEIDYAIENKIPIQFIGQEKIA